MTGTLGPILRHALSSQAESQTQTCTIVRADVHDAIDLVDLVHVLDAHGLRVDGIYRLDG